MKKLVSLLCLTSLITACGGGGGGSTTTPNSTTNPTPVTSLSIGQVSSAIEFDEGTSYNLSIPVNYNGGKPLSYTATTSNELVAVSVSNDTITLSSNDIDSLEEIATINISVSDGALNDSASVNATVVNASLGALFMEVAEKTAGIRDMVEREATQNVILRYTEQARMLGNIGKQEMDVIRDFTLSVLTMRSTALMTSLDAIPASLSGVTSELDLIDSLAILETAQAEFASSASEYIESMSDLGDLGLPALTTEIVIDGKLLPFFGNPAYGQVSNGRFTYDQQYSLFEYIAPENQTVCLAKNS